MPKVNFRISSGLKSIIGRELITDDFIAVFELVKNSFDANAKRVDIVFEFLDSDEASITIKDNGKGMTESELIDKWLFVAYSAKKEGVEDYRDRIRGPRIYAGAKGIGRFSCDKLGSKLELLTRTKTTGQATKLAVDWDEFEQDSRREFVDIPVSLSYRRKPIPRFGKGTILNITNLREKWDRPKLLKLKQSLEKLINPTQHATSRAFSIHLKAQSEQAEDIKLSEKEPWKRVNGPITNFIFEELRIKATSIRIDIPQDGSKIVTRLEDRGRFIYEISEDNDFDICGISIRLFVLNKTSKSAFTRKMGVRPVNYGSVFLYKNGFRIYPHGERGRDPWGIDDRKQQGQSRFLGTRDLIGRVEINGANPEFKEASSRDGGLIYNQSVESLNALVLKFAIRRLERFAIDIIKWGSYDNSSGEVKSRTLELILSLTKSKSIQDIDYNPDILDIVEEASEKSLRAVIGQFRDLAEKTGNTQLERDAKKAERRMRALQKARAEAEAESERHEREKHEAQARAKAEREKAEEADRKAHKARKQRQKVETQNLFLQSIVSADVKNLVGLHHHISIAAMTIQNYVKSTLKRIRSGKPITTDMFLEVLQKITLEARQVELSTNFATKANFSMDAALIKKDLIEFVREYIMNVCTGKILTGSNSEIKLTWKADEHLQAIRKFRPFEVVVLIDNLLSNASKAGATRVTIAARKDGRDEIAFLFFDNGRGISKDAMPKLFQAGFTTTQGSGFGLFHAAQIAERMGGSLRANPKIKSGAEFRWKVSI